MPVAEKRQQPVPATSTMYYILCTIAGAAIDRAPSFSSGYSMSLFGFIHTELMHICQKHGKKDLLMASHKSHIFLPFGFIHFTELMHIYHKKHWKDDIL